MEGLIERLIERWLRYGIALRAGLSLREIESFEALHGVQLDPEMRALYGRVDGMEEGVMDPVNLVRLWPLSEVTPAEQVIPDAGPAFRGYMVFADHSVWAHGYGLYTGPEVAADRRVVIVGGDELIAVADSFSRFIEYYLSDDRRLFGSGVSGEPA
jgi:hypothetical protein